MGTSEYLSRRALLLAAAPGVALLLTGSSAGAQPAQPPGGQEKEGQSAEEQVSAGEDLMREHGVLERLLLIYEALCRRAAAGQDMPADALHDAAGLVRNFIEDYHEKLEEEFVFPLFRQARQEVELVELLLRQHQAGRAVTERVLTWAGGAGGQTNELRTLLERFISMYRPHAAREDTVVFPRLAELVGQREYHELGEQFEQREHKLLGEEGFSGVVARVAGIERGLGIHDLSQFTPSA